MKQFVSCHCHPASLDSASTPAAFVDREIELGSGAITVTDHGSLAACRQIYDLAKTKGITPILGLEGYFKDANCPILTAAGVPKNKDGNFSDYIKYQHITLGFLDQAAYETGVRLLSRAPAERHGQELKPLFDWAALEELGAQNVTATSSCLIGMVSRFLLDHDNADLAIAYYERLRSVFKPGNFYAEVFPHKCDQNWVQGVFVSLAGGDAIGSLRFYDNKKLMVRALGKTETREVIASDLAREFSRKERPVLELVAVKNRNTWAEQNPQIITEVKRIEDFLPNPCRPWMPDGDAQRGVNRFVLMLAKRYGDKVLCSDDSHFARPEDKIVQDVRLAQGGSWRFHTSYHRLTSAEAWETFKAHGFSMEQFEEWVDNSLEWADRFKGFTFKTEVSLPSSFYPQDTMSHAIHLIRKHGRMDWNNATYLDRLRQEFKILHQNGSIDLFPYFFLAEEVCAEYEKAGKLTGPGRGSAAGLLLSYLLGITHVDPLEFNLSLDRFITLDRIRSGKLPDIDQDLPSRDLLTEPETGWLHRRFGNCFAQISADTTLRLRSSVKDVARFRYGQVPENIENLTKRFVNAPTGVSDINHVMGYQDADSFVLGTKDTDPAIREYITNYPQDWEIVQKALGLSKNKTRHASAYIIANRPIEEFIPTMDISGVRCTQYTAPSVEAVGGVKMDYLVINVLNDIADCIKLVQERGGVEIPAETIINGRRVPSIRILPHHGQLLDIWKLWESPMAAPVFRDIAEGKTETVFQFNTSGAVKWLRQFNHEKPDGNKLISCIEDMAIFTALDRPGPLDALIELKDGTSVNMLIEYARRARGLEPGNVPEIFNELLPETLGLLCFQEQVQKIYQHLTGCTGAEAEEFRSNVAKKKKEKMIKAYPIFMDNAGAKIGIDNAQKIWDAIEKFSSYAFCLAHATSYAIIAYSCAYLKHHFPLEWWCSVLKNADKTEVNDTFWAHCGHLIDLPDVKLSGPNFEIHGTRIRAPISLLQGVGETAHRQLCAGMPYADINDFCQKIQAHRVATAKTVQKIEKKKDKKTGTISETPVTKKALGHSALNRGVVYRLIISGAMDSLFPTHATQTVGEQEFITELSTIDRLMLYEDALAAATGAKRHKIDSTYANINQIVRYQMRKETLPAYSAPVLPMLVDRQSEGVTVRETAKGVRTFFKPSRGEELPFTSGGDLEALGQISPWPEGLTITTALAAYVTAYRKFAYGEGKSKSAVELVLDIDGHTLKTVRWPDRRTGTIPAAFRQDLTGAVIILTVSKRAEEKPWAAEEVVTIQSSLSNTEQSPDTEASK